MKMTFAIWVAMGLGVTAMFSSPTAFAGSPLPPDVQARLAEENAKAQLVTGNLGEDERAWTFSVYVPGDKIVWKVGEKPEAVLEIRDAENRLVPDTALTNVLCQLDWYADYRKTNEWVRLTEAGNPFRRSLALDRPGVKCFTATLFFEKPAGAGKRMGHPQKLVSVHQAAKDKRIRNGLSFRVGALVDPLKIKPGKPEPADFDKVWAKVLKEDAKLPNEPLLKRLRKVLPGGMEHWEVVLDSLGGPVFVEYSVPPSTKKGQKLPLIVSLQAYGTATTFPESWHWWALSIAPNCHSISNYQNGAYYAECAKKLGNFGFPTNENDKLETCYHARMLMRDIRAVRWALSQPECNGEVITTGGSQGGFQAMSLAGIFPQVVAASGYCPWYVDIGGSQTHWRPTYQPGPAYADPVYWMSRTKARRVKYLVGIVDTACPCDGEMAMFNAIPDTCEEAEIYIFQSRGHDVGDQVTYPRYRFVKRFGQVTGAYFPQGTRGVRADSTVYHPATKKQSSGMTRP